MKKKIKSVATPPGALICQVQTAPREQYHTLISEYTDRENTDESIEIFAMMCCKTRHTRQIKQQYSLPSHITELHFAAILIGIHRLQLFCLHAFENL